MFHSVTNPKLDKLLVKVETFTSNYGGTKLENIPNSKDANHKVGLQLKANRYFEGLDKHIKSFDSTTLLKDNPTLSNQVERAKELRAKLKATPIYSREKLDKALENTDDYGVGSRALTMFRRGGAAVRLMFVTHPAFALGFLTVAGVGKIGLIIVGFEVAMHAAKAGSNAVGLNSESPSNATPSQVMSAPSVQPAGSYSPSSSSAYMSGPGYGMAALPPSGYGPGGMPPPGYSAGP